MRSLAKLLRSNASLVLFSLGIVYLLFSVINYGSATVYLDNKITGTSSSSSRLAFPTRRINKTNNFTKKIFEHLYPYNPNRPTEYLKHKYYQGLSMKRTMSNFVIHRLKNKTNGFFVECGAFDGLFLSNTVLLERDYNWTGLLVEADPGVLPELKRRNRKAWVADVCLSPKPIPMTVNMTGTRSGAYGHAYINNPVIAEEREDKLKYSRKFQVECYPLDMLLEALEVTHVDYLSLDVEGVELEILKTIPWGKYRIDIISAEVRSNSKDDIREYLESVGYEKIHEIMVGEEAIHDFVFERVSDKLQS